MAAPAGWRHPARKADRNAALVAAADAGESLASLGRRFGVSPHRVRQIVERERSRLDLAALGPALPQALQERPGGP